MIEQKLPTGLFQTFYVSKEMSNCPFLIEMMRLGRTLEMLGVPDDGYCTISFKYGKRLLINAKHVNVRELTQQDVIEIVDYDPLKRVILVIGTKDPPLETPVHWIIQTARHDITVMLEITSGSVLQRFSQDLPCTEQDTPFGTLERAKELLKTLRNGKSIRIKNEGILLTGLNTKDLEETLRTQLKG